MLQSQKTVAAKTEQIGSDISIVSLVQVNIAPMGLLFLMPDILLRQVLNLSSVCQQNFILSIIVKLQRTNNNY
jgi:hypothetical protein